MRGMAKKRENGNSWGQHFKTVLKLEVTFLEKESKNWLEQDRSAGESVESTGEVETVHVCYSTGIREKVET